MDISLLLEWNPWWEEISSIDSLKGMKRELNKDIIDSVDIKEVTVISGIRRCGKSTLMYQMIDRLFKKGIKPEQILFINFDDITLKSFSIEEIYKTYRLNLNPQQKAYIFLDEIHKKDGWESWIRKRYDTSSNEKFVVSGSCSHLLKKEYSTLLTGRNITFEMYPLSFYEYLTFIGQKIDPEKISKGIITEKTRIKLFNALSHYSKEGGFPEVTLKDENFKMKILKQYFDDILFKDILTRHNINTQKALDLAKLFMTEITDPLSLRKIRDTLGLSYGTINDYLSHFMEAYLFFKLDYFSYSFREQKHLPSKIYCIDNGLRNSVAFSFSKDEGKLAENLVMAELKRQDNECYYWKNEKGHEVDFVIKETDNSFTAINVTYTDDIAERETRALKSFNEIIGKPVKMILITKDLETEKDNIKFIPLGKYLLQ